MRFKIKTFFFALLMVSFTIFLKVSFAQIAQEEFVYDSTGKRDPFISLLDKDSPTGLRRIFTRPDAQVKLPVKVTLKGILQKGKQFFAIINGEVMKKGDKINGVEIKEIEKDKVILEYGEREFAVFLRKEQEK